MIEPLETQLDMFGRAKIPGRRLVGRPQLTPAQLDDWVGILGRYLAPAPGVRGSGQHRTVADCTEHLTAFTERRCEAWQVEEVLKWMVHQRTACYLGGACYGPPR